MGTTDVVRPKGTKNAWTWSVVEKDVHLTDEVAAGLTDHIIYCMDAGAHTQDEHIDEIMLCLENPAGGGKTVTLEVDAVDSTMTVAVAGATALFAETTTGNFDWDVSAEELLVRFTTSGGTTAGRLSVHIKKHEVTIV